jgi:Flp pilus assembly protein TadG
MTRRYNQHHRSGATLPYLAMAMFVLIGFASFAVDWGRVQLVKTELQRTSDAAAMAAASNLGAGGTIAQIKSEAALWAGKNTTDGGNAVALADADVEPGVWDDAAHSFTAAATVTAETNAVRVTTRRTVPLVLAGVFGIKTKDVAAVATAKFRQASFGLIGLEYINMSGNASTGYWSKTGTVVNKHGSIASNGDITLGGSTMVYGDALPGVGKTVINGPGHVTGSMTPLATPLAFPNGDASPYGPSNNDNSYVSTYMPGNSPNLKISKNESPPAFPGGHYFVQDLELQAGGTLTFSGETTIYAYGNVDLHGHAVTYGNVPGNLKIVMVPHPVTGAAPGTITVWSTTALYANIYAPQSPITLGGTGDLYGAVLGKSVDMTGTSAIHYDLDYQGAATAVLVR